MTPQPSPPSGDGGKKTNVGTIVGPIAAAVCLIGAAGALLLYRRRRVYASEELLANGHLQDAQDSLPEEQWEPWEVRRYRPEEGS